MSASTPEEFAETVLSAIYGDTDWTLAEVIEAGEFTNVEDFRKAIVAAALWGESREQERMVANRGKSQYERPRKVGEIHVSVLPEGLALRDPESETSLILNAEERAALEAHFGLPGGVTFEYAYGSTRLDGKAGIVVHRPYQTLRALLRAYNVRGHTWRRPVGAWQPIDHQTGVPTS